MQRGSGIPAKKDDEKDFKIAQRGSGTQAKPKFNPFGEAEPEEKESPFGNAEPAKLAPMKIAPINAGLMRKPDEAKPEASTAAGQTKTGFITATESN